MTRITRNIVSQYLALWIFCFALGLPLKAYSAPQTPAPFISVDWPSPRYFDRVPEHMTFSGVNLFTKSLDGYTETIGPAVIEYDERIPGTSNNAGNFLLQAIQFQNGAEVYLPIIDTTAGVLPVLKVGLRQYPLKLIFSEDYQTADFYPVHRDGYTLQKHGRFLFQREQGTPGHTPLSKLSDTGTGTVYGFLEGGGIYYPTSAELPDGFVVNFTYGDALNPTFVTNAALSRNGTAIETITASYVSGRINTVTSAIDQARNVQFLYNIYGNLSAVLRGGDFTRSGAIDGLVYYYSVTGSGPSMKYVIYSITNPRGKELIRFYLTDLSTGNGTRQVYNGVRLGPGSVNGGLVSATSFQYLADNKVRITTPQAPQNPTTVTLHATRGLAVKMSDAICPNPLEELQFIADGPNEGLLEQDKVRPRCDKLVLHTYGYNADGDLISITTEGGTETQLSAIDYTKLTFPNGTKIKAVKKITDPLGGDITYGYDAATGDLKTIEDNAENTQVSYDYEYYDAAKKSLKKLTTTNENSRRDYLGFDAQGRLIESALNVDTADKVSSLLFYDDINGRLRTVIDDKRNTESILYADDNPALLPDGRVKTTLLRSRDGTENRSVTYTYSSDFPALVTTATMQAGKANYVQTLTTSYGYISGTPYLETIQAQGTGLSTPVTLGKLYYDPPTLNVTKACGFSSDGTDQNCAAYNYKSSAGTFTGYLDNISVAGGASGGGYTSTVNYDIYGNAEGTTLSDESKSITTKVTFDDLNRLKEEILNPGETDLQAKTVYHYDGAGKLSNLEGYTGGELISNITTTYDNEGKSTRPLQIIDSVSGLKETFAYEDPAHEAPAKRMIRATSYTPGGAVLSNLEIASADYNLYDAPTKVTSFVDGVGNKILHFGFNKFQELTSYTDHLGNTATFGYDDFGREIQFTTALNNVTTSYGFDSYGLSLITSTGKNTTADTALQFSKTVTATEDVLGRITKVLDQQFSIRNEFAYDIKGNLYQLRKVYQPNGPSESYRLGYDNLGRLIQTSHQGAFTQGFLVTGERHFSGLGELKEIKDAWSNSTTFDYDLLSRPKAVHYPDGKSSTVTEYKYLPGGNSGPLERITQTDRAGDTITTLVNKLGQPTERTIQSQEYGAFTQALSYDSTTSRLSSNTVTSGNDTKSLTYAYDGLGRASGETTHITTPTKDFQFTLGKTYYDDGALRSHVYPNGSNTLYLRDSFNRIKSISLNGEPKAGYYYDGPVLTRVDLRPGPVPLRRSFTYGGNSVPNSAPLLSGLSDKLGATTFSAVSYSYDDQYQLAARVDSGTRQTTEQFTYTPDHMLTTYTISSPLISGGPITRNYNTQLDGVLYAIQAPNSIFELPSSFSYDARGNPLHESVTNGKTFTWSHSGLIGVLDPEIGYSTQLTQDALGRYVRFDRQDIQGHPSSTTYGRDSGMILWEHDE